MTINVSKVSGGPYAHEVDAIRDERYRASVMGIEPDFESVFAGVEFISTGAAAVINDIGKPIELPVGEFIENVVFNDEEVAPESAPEEEASEGDKEGTETSAPEATVSESGNAESDTDTEVSELEDIFDTPLFDEVSHDSAN